jgi:hypothetical protein
MAEEEESYLADQEETAEEPTEEEPEAGGEAEYAFQGFTVEFSDKVMLTPVSPNRKPAY